MRLDEAEVKCYWKKLTGLNENDQVNLLFLFILLMTMKLLLQGRNICLADMICAFDAEVLTRRFEKMVYRFVQDAVDDIEGQKMTKQKKSVEELSWITAFLKNLNTVYLQRSSISEQAEHYLCALYIGMESENKYLEWRNLIREDINARLKKGSIGSGQSLEDFLFTCGQPLSADTKNRFYDAVVILKTYVTKCQQYYQIFSQGEVDELLGMLAEFNCRKKTADQIRGLYRATFGSKESFRADARLILGYLKNADIRNKIYDIMVQKECWNTWEMASA
ncbi:MAG: hypothetical protein NC420_00580 [Eubacterium sp.]|nr:hypothetical protein [Eubacterium sp.]MCM1237874.1 hypothetical protein [Lachnospiraceae bacterium]